MTINFSSAKLTGTPSISGWTQVFECKGENKGRLLVLVAITPKESPGVGELNLGRSVLSDIQDIYFSTHSAAFDSLKAALEKTFKKNSKNFANLEIATLAVVGDIAYAASIGEIKTLLLRDGALVNLTGDSSKAKITAASGFIQGNDTFLLATHALFTKVGEGVIKASLGGSSVQAVVESLAPHARTGEDLGKIGLAVIKFEAFKISDAPVQNPKTFGLPLSADNKPSYQTSKPIRGIKAVLVDLIDKILTILPERKIFVAGENPPRLQDVSKKKKVAVAAGAVLLLLLIISIGFGIKQSRLKAEKEKYEGRLTEAQHQLAEAKDLKSLNSTRSRELLISAKKTSQDLSNEGVKDERLTKLIADISESFGPISGIYEEEPSLFLDLTWIINGFKGDRLAFSEDKMLVADIAGKKLVSIAADSKKTKTVAGPDVLPETKDIAFYSDRSFVASSDGIWEIIGEKAKKVIGDGGDVKIYAFAANLYVLNQDNSTISRYPGIGDGSFGDKQNWFGRGVAPDLTDFAGWTIDGSVWILLENGKILRFTQGAPVSFSLDDSAGNLNGAVDIFTNEEADYLYVLDPANSRVLVLGKDGKYKAEYKSEKIKEAGKLVVSEKYKKIILLSGSNLYSLEIKHL